MQLSSLAQLLDNPWFKHFQTVWLNERDNAIKMVFNAPVKDQQLLLNREQVIGEARAYQLVAEQPQETYNRLVKKIEDSRNAD